MRIIQNIHTGATEIQFAHLVHGGYNFLGINENWKVVWTA